jgi:hypothetical protein
MLLVSLVLPAVASASDSSDGLWHDVTESDALAAGTGKRVLFPRTYRVVSLNVHAFQDLARTAPLELTYGVEDISPTMTLPMPDGSFGRFRIQESLIMEPKLAARLADVKTYRGQGIDDPTATARLDFTPAGFHGFIRSSRGAVYIDPFLSEDTTYYISYWRRDYGRGGDAAPFRCDFAQVNAAKATKKRASVSSENKPAVLAASGTTLRTYRLALAGTGEYTEFYGGTVPLAQAGMVTTMNRVNGIFEQDVAVRMVMVDNTAIVFADSETDPYNNDSDDLAANQVTIDLLIGTTNYDIGHLFGTGGGGVAYLESVCDVGFKAQGLTGSGGPIGDAFDVDYVAHEMGHQFGGNHTFNGTTGSCGGGNRESGAAYEPGSGSTIMAYAGICGAENLQPNSDPYFHVKSFDEIVAFTTDLGDECAVQTSTGNSAPIVNAGATITIPRSTPFYLTGSATDPDDDPLTYCWEQFNLGTASPPSTDNGSRPIFRSFNPAITAVRTFPKLSDLLANTTTLGESLPTTSRTMTFRLTARDNSAGGGGVDYGSTSVSVTSAAGPFVVTAPNTALTWNGNSTQNVTWNVANTASAPVSCANVKILLSNDGGFTFPTTLLASTPNDGTQPIAVPNVATNVARIRVECATSPFFDLSNVNFAIAQSIDVVATATSATNVDVTWTAVSGAVSYEIYRRAAPGSYSLIGTSSVPSYSDPTVTAGKAYLYAVKSVDATPTTSALSAPDLATTFFFTDPALTGVLIKAIHITELRTAINTLRTLAGLSAFSFTDSSLTVGVTTIKAAHINELRTALSAVFTALGFTPATYTDPTLVAGTTVVKAVHVQDLRTGVQ